MKNVEQLYAIRFFQGVTEASTFVGTHYVLGSWYKTGELGKRSGIFTSSGLIGTLFSGVLQAAVYQHLGGVSGRSGWRWLFIIDGVITLPIALYGFLVFPNVPSTTNAFYLSGEERRLAVARVQKDNRSSAEGMHGRLSWDLVRRVLGRWRWYGCSLLFAISGECESFGSNNLMGLWLKAIGGYTVEEIDYYPSGVTAVGIVSTLVCATWTDSTRSRARWPVLVWMVIAVIVASICIVVWSSPIGLKFFAYYLAGASYSGQATTFAWANQICADDDQERAIVLASMNMWNNVINAWWPLIFYPATDAPKFRKGMWAMIGTGVATLMVTFFVWYMEQREKRSRLVLEEDDRAIDEKISEKDMDEKVVGE